MPGCHWSRDRKARSTVACVKSSASAPCRLSVCANRRSRGSSCASSSSNASDDPIRPHRDETTLHHRFIPKGIKRGHVMSSFVHRSLIGAAAAAILAGSAGAQLLPGVGLPALPPVNLPTRNVPVIGPTLQDILAQPGAREAVSPTLNTVSGLPERIAEAPAATLLELRQFRLRELMRQHPRELDNDGNGQPVRRGVLVAVDPDQPSLQLAARAGFAIVADDRDPALGIRSVTLSVPAQSVHAPGPSAPALRCPAFADRFRPRLRTCGRRPLPFRGSSCR